MIFPKKTLLASLFLLSANSVFAADTAELSVIGSISPSACTPSFSANGVVDYGVIANNSLNPDTPTTLLAKNIDFSIICDAATSVAFSFTDNRPDTEIAVPSTATSKVFGLGKHGEQNIGGYNLNMNLSSITGDGEPATLIVTTDSTQWFQSTSSMAEGNGAMYSLAPSGTLVPGAYSNFDGTMAATATIQATDLLDISEQVTLDGLATMTVIYL